MNDWSERREAFLSGRALPPIVEFLGVQVIEVRSGQATLQLEPRPELTNAMGTLHGGVLCDLADMAMGYALAAALVPGQSFTTVELKANYFRPAGRSMLTAQARLVHQGSTLAYLECDVSDAKGAAVARVASTCMLLSAQVPVVDS